MFIHICMYIYIHLRIYTYIYIYVYIYIYIFRKRESTHALALARIIRQGRCERQASNGKSRIGRESARTSEKQRELVPRKREGVRCACARTRERKFESKCVGEIERGRAYAIARNLGSLGVAFEVNVIVEKADGRVLSKFARELMAIRAAQTQEHTVGRLSSYTSLDGFNVLGVARESTVFGIRSFFLCMLRSIDLVLLGLSL